MNFIPVNEHLGLHEARRAKSQALNAMRRRSDKLPKGTVAAMRASNWRIPDDAPDEARELAQQALERIADVMHGRVPLERQASVLKAATDIRAEVCGPPTQRMEIKGKMGLMALLTAAARLDESEAPIDILPSAISTPTLPPPRDAAARGPVIRKKEVHDEVS